MQFIGSQYFELFWLLMMVTVNSPTFKIDFTSFSVKYDASFLRPETSTHRFFHAKLYGSRLAKKIIFLKKFYNLTKNVPVLKRIQEKM